MKFSTLLFRGKKAEPETVATTAPAKVVPIHRSRPSFTAFKVGRRNFSAGIIDRLTADFTGSNLSFNSAVRPSLRIMRARSRQLTRNEPYSKAFLESAVRNIIGHDGLRFKNVAVHPDGMLDISANTRIKLAFDKWGQKKYCTVSKRRTWTGAQKVICRMMVRDGEVLIRKVRGFANDFKFSLQIIPCDHLDETYNEDRLANGNKIIMGVEVNSWGERVAYHLLKVHPSDVFSLNFVDQYRERVDAKEICHLFVEEDSDQVRGIPWLYVAITRLNQLGAYEEAEVIAARLAACKMGFFTSKTDEAYQGDDEDEEGNTIIEASPGQFEELKPGQDFKAFDAQHPNANLPAFTKAMLRGICAGLTANYNLIAQDLEGVNFSSIRAGTLDERECWKMLQQLFVEQCADDCFESWLEMALLTDFLKPLPYSKFDKFNAPYFRGRRWPWVDPEKDLRAQAFAVLMRWKTNSEVIEDLDGDPDEVWNKIKEEMKKMDALGITQAVPQMLSFLQPEKEEEVASTPAKPKD